LELNLHNALINHNIKKENYNFKCTVCNYKDKSKKIFNSHMTKHLNIFTMRKFGVEFKNLLKNIQENLCYY